MMSIWVALYENIGLFKEKSMKQTLFFVHNKFGITIEEV